MEQASGTNANAEENIVLIARAQEESFARARRLGERGAWTVLDHVTRKHMDVVDFDERNQYSPSPEGLDRQVDN